MEQQRIIKIYEIVAEKFPDFQVFMLPTRRLHRMFLFQDTQPHSDFDEWCRKKVDRIHFEIFDFLKNEKGQYDYPLFFDAHEGFVFYTPHWDYRFKGFSDIEKLKPFGHGQYTRVICPNTNQREVLEHLMFNAPI